MRGLLASPLGFLIGLSIGALGGGGSILAVPVLVYAAGQDPRHATATSLILVGVAAGVGSVGHRRAGRVQLGTGLVFGAAGIPGSLLGSYVNRQLDPDVLLLAFSVLIVVAAWRMLTACPTCTQVGEQIAIGRRSGGAGTITKRPLDPATVLAVLAAGTGVGFLTGLFGVGGGFVIVPALTLVLKMPMPRAIGTSLVVIAVNSAVALATRLATTSIDWGVTLPFVVASVAGVLTGGSVAGKLDPRKSLRAFATLLVAVAVYTAVDASLSLVG